MSDANNKQTGAVQTTGHAWDGDIQEYNNPLPKWWVWAFYASAVFTLIYWIAYPAWPIGDDYTKGVFNTITYKTEDGEERTTQWNTRALLADELQTSDSAVTQREWLTKIAAKDYDAILSDADSMAFVRSMGKVLFADNCAACHGTGGNGVMTLFPNLVDDAWLWGGSEEQIEETLRHGRYGFMPAYKETFTPEQVDEVSNYVMTLSGLEADQDKALRGEQLFNGEEGGCYYCHTSEGTGMYSQGAANLTDSIWTVADVPGAESAEAKKAAIKHVVTNGIQRVMPAWEERLGKDEIKILTAYVVGMSAGE